MRASVKLFGPVAQTIGRSELIVTIEGETVTCGDLRQNLIRAEPRLAASAKHGRFAVNYKYVDDGYVIQSDDEIALIAMISGG